MNTPPPPRKPGPTLPGFRTPTDSRTLWFSRTGCVVWHASGRRDVLIGRALIGSFEANDTTTRNVLLVLLSKEDLVLEDLAHAFGVTSETVRLVRRAYESGGYEAVAKKKRGARGPWKVTAKVKKKVEGCFAEGLDVPQTVRKLNGLLSANTVRALHKAWKAAQEQPAPEAPHQGELLPVVVAEVTPAIPVEIAEGSEGKEPEQPARQASEDGALVAKTEESTYCVRALARDDGALDARTLSVGGPASHGRVQFLGAWLLLAMTARLGLHSAVTTQARKGTAGALRLAVDAVAVALGVGEACVELRRSPELTQVRSPEMTHPA